MVLAALMATVRKTTGSDTAVAVLILTFLVPAVLFSTLGGVLVERSNARIIMLATNIIRAVGTLAFILVAPSTDMAIVPLVYLINFGIATATAIFAPAELTAIPRIVDRRNLMAANSMFVLTINATFAIGFGFIGPLILNVLGPIAVYVTVAIMFGLAAIAIVPLPDVGPTTSSRRPATPRGARCACSRPAGRRGGFVAPAPAIAWSLAYLGISSSLIGVLGAIGPGFAVDILGLTERELLLHHGPRRAGRRGRDPVPELVRQGDPEAARHRPRTGRHGHHPGRCWRSSSRSRKRSDRPRRRSRRWSRPSRRSSA